MAQAFPYVPPNIPQGEELPFDYAAMLNSGPPPAEPSAAFYTAMAPTPGMPAAAPQPQANPEAALHVPTTNIQEIESRKEGWMQVINRVASDPNLMRAIGMFGAHMMQPMQQGETNMGRLGQAWMTGRSAYDFGKEAEFNRALQMRREGRAEESHRLEVTTGQARLPGIQAQSRVAVGTADSKITEARQAVEIAAQQLANSKLTGQKAGIELKKLERQEKIMESLPPNAERDSILADLQKNKAELAKIAAQTNAANASAGASSAQAALTRSKQKEQDLENKDNEALTPEERRAQRNRKGATSAQVQMSEQVQALYRQANPNATPQQAAQAALDFFKDKKVDDFEQYIKFAEIDPPKPGESPTQHYQRYQQIRGLVTGKNTPTPAGESKLGAAGTAIPKVGEVREKNGVKAKFKGGNPADPKNWEILTK